MIRLSIRFASALALGALSLPAFQAVAQQDVPAAAAQEPSVLAPSAPAPSAAPVFPKPDPASFTAATPSRETVSAFLQTNWGFDDTRAWQVQAILKTPVEGVSRVLVLVADKAGKQKPGQLEFFVLPGGKYIMVVGDDSLVPFGEHPYADARATLQQRADGPYRGSALKDLEIVEFADFQCPHCKDAQANMDKLAADYPQAHIVFEADPIPSIHPQAVLAASYGYCVAKQAGSTAFFQFASAVFDGQDGLATADGAQLTLNSAIAKAGADAAKVSACAATPEAKNAVEASRKLAGELGINQVPTLIVNGRSVPANAPYETLKKIVDFQIKLDAK